MVNRADDWAGLTDAGDGTGAAASRGKSSRDGSRRKPRAASGARRGTDAAPPQRRRSGDTPSALTPDAEAWLASAGPPPDWAQDIVAAAPGPVASEDRPRSSGPERASTRAAVPFEADAATPETVPDEDPGEYLESGADESSGRRKRPSGRKRKEPREAGPPAHPEEEARAIILRQLTGSAKSRQQLADKLAEREIPDAVAGQVLDRFEELGLINDREFALMWVRSRAGTRRLAASALRRELVQKGIDDEFIVEALEQVTEDDERRAARELVDKKLRSQGSADLNDRLQRDKVIRRLVSMLARKGYGGGVAFGVVNEAIREAREE
ncbi:RecX family transcriptional regulator [Zhihengliuella halotolerans]|uniref:RecX family transcriptional regulator n=1 Tax=Zhihengliuella halotolerans TaxID=370736 RepID=UPI000C80CEEE|nr:RecX family transcriptional regulator [Zhihengliuella halotolerans]